MADLPNEKPEATAPVADAQEASAGDTKIGGAEPVAVEDKATTGEEARKEDTEATAESKLPKSSEKPTETSTEELKEGEEKLAADKGDVEMKDATEAPAAEEAAADTSAPPADAEPAPADASVKTPTAKGKGRRKSTGTASKGKALNRKGSKARLTNLDAKPGDHFLVKLKGFPAWPAIICDESMLPQALVDSRPMTAARPDGSYHEPYADGGKRITDRNFPVMYLFTNEFGWVANTNLTELSPDKAEESVTEKMRKDLREAFLLAAENNPVEHYKEMLKNFQEEQIAQEEAKRAAAATPKKSKKGKAKAVEDDVDMADADDSILQEKPKSSKKRKAEDEVSTPARSDSVKKPKIKLNTSSTPKVANGTPKGKDESAVKSKSKTKKGKEGADKKAEAPKEPKMTPEERLARKEKEVLYLRHKLQRGLLTRDQQPQESEMKGMSDYITMLENFKDLEVSIIRNTKINKVLKAILKLESIPREDEFKFKTRSQALLDKWNTLMAGDGAAAPTNGVNGSSKAKSEEKEAHESEGKGGPEEPKKAALKKLAEESSDDKADTESEAKPDASVTEEKEENSASKEAVVPPEPVEAVA